MDVGFVARCAGFAAALSIGCVFEGTVLEAQDLGSTGLGSPQDDGAQAESSGSDDAPELTAGSATQGGSGADDADSTTGPEGDSSGGEPGTPCDPARAGVCPEPGVRWNFQLQGEIDRGADAELWVVDLFDVSGDAIAALHGGGRVVVCSFGAGNHETWRPDADEFPGEAIGNPIDGYEEERWLDPRHPGVRARLEARLDLARDRGCDGVEPANVEAYLHDSGFPLVAQDQLDFNRWLAEQAHARTLSVGLSGDRPHVPQLVDDFDWGLVAACFEEGTCDALAPFVAAGKAVLAVEYVDDPADAPAALEAICGRARAAGLSAILKRPELDAWFLSC